MDTTLAIMSLIQFTVSLVGFGLSVYWLLNPVGSQPLRRRR